MKRSEPKLSEDNAIKPGEAAREADARGVTLFQTGRFREALAQFESALTLDPANSDFRYNLTCAAWATGDITRTRHELQTIIDRDPGFPKAHDALARLLHESGQVSSADVHSARAVELNPSDPEFALTRAVVLSSLSRASEAWDAVQPALEARITADRAAALCANIAPSLKREAQADLILQTALTRSPDHPAFRRQLHFAAAAFFDRTGRYDEAFTQAALAHAINRRRYDPAARARDFKVRTRHWTASKVQRLARATHGSTRPVFILGMPRSGTSLVEQILGCHPVIHAAGELDAMNRTAKALDSLGLPYPQSLEALTTESANRVAEVYLKHIGSLNATARYLTDKMPLNFIYLDLIAVLLPASHVIHCTRDPLDTCLSCYMTDFHTPYDFAEDLRDLGSFYTHYENLMEHWTSLLPLKILEVRYEEVVADVETQSRRMLEFLGLEWDPRCLLFHESSRTVNTASREQVKQPIYTSSVGRWRQYERHLAPLKEALDKQGS